MFIFKKARLGLRKEFGREWHQERIIKPKPLSPKYSCGHGQDY
jgi:hypothetical protein